MRLRSPVSALRAIVGSLVPYVAANPCAIVAARALRYLAGDDDWPLFDKNLLLHTIENEDDILLSLGDPQAAQPLEAAFRQISPCP